MRLSLSFIGIIFCLAVPVDAAEMVFIGSRNNGMPQKAQVFYARKNEKLSIVPAADSVRDTVPITWQRITPVIREYNNVSIAQSRSPYFVEPIAYRTDKTTTNGNSLDFVCTSPGTFTFAAGSELSGLFGAEFSESESLYRRFPNVIQIICREDDSYIGYLGELTGTPFIMAPKMLSSGHHQVDERIGCDCASFAVYGMRRMGRNIPYAGPRGIIKYLQEIVPGPLVPQKQGGIDVYTRWDDPESQISTADIQPGDIVHFGEQVAVFYRDAGVPGILDADDLIIQSSTGGPGITTFRSSGYFGRPFRIYRWKNK